MLSSSPFSPGNIQWTSLNKRRSCPGRARAGALDRRQRRRRRIRLRRRRVLWAAPGGGNSRFQGQHNAQTNAGYGVQRCACARTQSGFGLAWLPFVAKGLSVRRSSNTRSHTCTGRRVPGHPSRHCFCHYKSNKH